ncbi:hypothetical protein EYC80_003770 [Monilinia laxa]|uniref:Uncharacterized protein n=1 Tax=Monilinia laxa TaxID=61186 RepID=A0A5N6KKY2_MONLA|nr:hypothetical protein EYC80_003770 [Monilinia laxa]
MAFYDSSSDQEVGFPIILEPDDDDSLFEMRVDDTRMNNDTMKEVHQVREVKKAEEVNKNTMSQWKRLATQVEQHQKLATQLLDDRS